MPKLPSFQKRLAVHESLPPPRLGVWSDFLLEEAPRLLTERIVLRVENQTAHGGALETSVIGRSWA
jgi:hypothetical protein